MTWKLPRLLWCGVVKENGGQGSLGRERLVASIDEDTKDTKDIFLISKQRYRGYQSNIRVKQNRKIWMLYIGNKNNGNLFYYGYYCLASSDESFTFLFIYSFNFFFIITFFPFLIGCLT